MVKLTDAGAGKKRESCSDQIATKIWLKSHQTEWQQLGDGLWQRLEMRFHLVASNTHTHSELVTVTQI